MVIAILSVEQDLPSKDVMQGSCSHITLPKTFRERIILAKQIACAFIPSFLQDSSDQDQIFKLQGQTSTSNLYFKA
jgi:hypothetical protein